GRDRGEERRLLLLVLLEGLVILEPVLEAGAVRPEAADGIEAGDRRVVLAVAAQRLGLRLERRGCAIAQAARIPHVLEDRLHRREALEHLPVVLLGGRRFGLVVELDDVARRFEVGAQVGGQRGLLIRAGRDGALQEAEVAGLQAVREVLGEALGGDRRERLLDRLQRGAGRRAERALLSEG